MTLLVWFAFLWLSCGLPPFPALLCALWLAAWHEALLGIPAPARLAGVRVNWR